MHIVSLVTVAVVVFQLYGMFHKEIFDTNFIKYMKEENLFI